MLSQCTYRCVVLPDEEEGAIMAHKKKSQCTYRCVVLPDAVFRKVATLLFVVSMHLQVRGAP